MINTNQLKDVLQKKTQRSYNFSQFYFQGNSTITITIIIIILINPSSNHHYY